MHLKKIFIPPLLKINHNNTEGGKVLNPNLKACPVEPTAKGSSAK